MIEKDIDKNEIAEESNPFAQEQESIVEESTETIASENNLQNELEQIKNQYVRLAADFDNYRKRQAQERESLLKYGAEDTLKKLLTVLDTFERAVKSLETMDDSEKIKESFNVVYKQFTDALEKAGLQKIETNGQQFDPNFHEAVMQTPTEEHEDHAIINELQSGYMIGEKILRAALVNVAVNQ